MLTDLTGINGAGVADWLTAIGTLGAVVVALWLQWWLVRQRRPSLKLEFESARDRVDVVQRVSSPHEPLEYRSHWVRPRVTNRRRCDSAENVEVLLVSVEASDGIPGSPSPPTSAERLLEGLPLKWSEVDSTKVSIPPGAARHFDLLHVDNLRVEADGEHVKGGAPIRFDVYPVPLAKYHRAFRTRYEVTLALTARDTDAAFYNTIVTYDLQWHEDMDEMRKALRIEPFKGPESNPAAL